MSSEITPIQLLAQRLGLPSDTPADAVAQEALVALGETQSAPRTIFALGDHRIAVHRVDGVSPDQRARTLAVQLTKGAFIQIRDLDDPAHAAAALNALVDVQPRVTVVRYMPPKLTRVTPRG